MQVNSVNNSQSFQARIKLNKSNIKTIGKSAVLGTTATAGAVATSIGSIGVSQFNPNVQEDATVEFTSTFLGLVASSLASKELCEMFCDNKKLPS